MIKRITTLLCALAVFMTTGIINPTVVHAAIHDYTLNIVWVDNNDTYGFRPDSVGYKIIDSSNAENVYASGTVTKDENWTETVQIDSEWGSVTLKTDSVSAYGSAGRISGTTFTQTYTSIYNSASDDIYIDTVWADNDDAAGKRPETYKITLSDAFGKVKEYDIAKGQTEYIVKDFPFAKDGAVNKITADTDAISGYKTTLRTSTTTSGFHVSVTHTLIGTGTVDALQPGLQTISYNGETMHVYKASGNEKITLLSASDSGGPGNVLDIAAFEATGKKIKAIVNASYFNNHTEQSTYGQTYGRIQGLSMGEQGYIDQRTGGPQDDWAAAELSAWGGNKPYMDLVIDKNGSVHAGDFNSWDWLYGDVDLGVAPAVIEIYNGKTTELYSPAVGTGKITAKNTQTAVAKTADGSWALVTVEGKHGGLAPRGDLKTWGNTYGTSELSFYDSGGSTQMIVNGSKVQYTGRRIPNTIIIYEDAADEPEQKEVTVTISFADTDADPQDLSAYQIIKTFTEGTTANTGIEETVNRLKNAGYEIKYEDWADYQSVDGQLTDIEIPVAHQKEAVTSQEEKTYKRTIKFVDEDGAAVATAVVQKLTAVIRGQGQKDSVTGKVVYSDEALTEWPDGSVYQEVAAPAVDGYTAKETKVAAADIADKSDDERTYEVSVEYTKNHNVVDVLVEFEDTDSNKQDMSAFAKVYTLDIDQHQTADLTTQIKAVTDAYFELVDPVPSVNGSKEHVVIKVKHKTESSIINEPCGSKDIKLVFSDKDEDETWTVEIQGTSEQQFNHDFVTNQAISSYNPGCYFEKTPVPYREGYTPDIEFLDGFRIGEENNLPDRIFYEKPSASSKIIHITFVDQDEAEPQDLSDYSRDITVTEGQVTDVDISDTLEALTEKNYIVNSDNVPASLTYDSDDVRIYVEHKKQSNTAVSGITQYRRIIKLLNEAGDEIAEPVIQELSYTFARETTIDLVTGKETKGAELNEWVDGKDTFAAVKVPDVPGYKSLNLEIPELTVTDLTRIEYTANVTYPKEQELVDFRVVFVDDNKDAQDLSSYTKTYSIDMAGLESYSLAEANDYINEVAGDKYIIVSRDESVSREDRDLTVHLDHKTYTDQQPRMINATRTIQFEGIDHKEISQVADVTAMVKGTRDMVTGEVVEEILSYQGKMLAFTPTPMDGYTVDPEILPEYDIETEVDLNKTVVVTYTKIKPDLEPRLASSLHFADNAKEMPASDSMSAYDDLTYYDLEPNAQYKLHSLLLVKGNEFSGDELEMSDTAGQLLVKEMVQDLTASETGSGEASVTFAFNGIPFENAELVVYNYMYDATGTNLVASKNSNNDSDTTIKVLAKQSDDEPEKDITIEFIDTDSDAQDLSEFDKVVKVGNEPVTVTIKDVISTLVSRGFEMIDEQSDEITIDGSKNVVSIHVKHGVDETSGSHEETVTRTIKFNGLEESRADEEQSAEMTVSYKEAVDKVTGKTISSSMQLSGRLPAYAVPEIEGYVADKNTVPEIDFAKLPEPVYEFTESITYTKMEPEQMAVTFMFNDIDSDEPIDLSSDTVTIYVKDGESKTVDLSDKLASFENRGLIPADSVEIPDAIDGSITEYTIDMVHKEVSQDITETLPIRRIIHFSGIEREDVIQEVNATVIRTERKDLATGRILETEIIVKGVLPEYEAPVVEGYKAEGLPAATIEEHTEHIDDLEATITYEKEQAPDPKPGTEPDDPDEPKPSDPTDPSEPDPNPPVDVTKTEIRIEYIDSDSEAIDLSTYNFKEEYEDVTKFVFEDASAKTIAELGNKGFALDKVDDSAENLYKVYMKHLHEVSENKVEKVFKRNVVLKYESGKEITNLLQEAKVSMITTIDTDRATGKMNTTVKFEPIEGEKHRFAKVNLPAIKGYTATQEYVELVELLDVAAEQKDEVTCEIVYKKDASSTEQKPDDTNTGNKPGKDSDTATMPNANGKNNDSKTTFGESSSTTGNRAGGSSNTESGTNDQRTSNARQTAAYSEIAYMYGLSGIAIIVMLTLFIIEKKKRANNA